jgi:uncharacterized membrane protein YsdA (DUF1294 family)
MKTLIGLILALVFLTAIGVGSLTATIEPLFFVLYAGVSLITFIVYAFDKSAARKGKWRTPEIHLHLLSLIGGWPGALIAQHVLRHKTQKQSFRFFFWITVILNLGIFIWAKTPSGASVFQPVTAAFNTLIDSF